jgi:DNA-binding MarR family transcriptional regulator
MIERGAQAAYDACINGRYGGGLRYHQLDENQRQQIRLRFAFGLTAALDTNEMGGRPLSAGITANQRRCLDIINEFITVNGFSPTLKEVGAIIGKPASRVHSLVQGLVERGYINKLANRRRSIQLIDR